MLVLLLPQLHPEGPAPTARRARRQPQGEVSGVSQLHLPIAGGVGEGLAGGEVG